MTHKKILLFTLSFSLHSAIMSMESEKTDVQGATETELQQHAKNLTQNIFKLNSPEVRNTHMSPLIHWLMQKRNEISDPTEWNDLVKQLDDSIKLPEGDPGTNAGALFFICIPQGIKNTIITHALGLQSNQNTTELIEKVNKNIDDYYNVVMLSAFC